MGEEQVGVKQKWSSLHSIQAALIDPEKELIWFSSLQMKTLILYESFHHCFMLSSKYLSGLVTWPQLLNYTS